MHVTKLQDVLAAEVTTIAESVTTIAVYATAKTDEPTGWVLSLLHAYH